jgi:hypothetical protein
MISSILSPIIAAILVGTGRFSSLYLTPIQWFGILLAVIFFIVTTVFLYSKGRSTFDFIKLLVKIVVSNWQLIVGLVLLLATLCSIYLTNSYWIMLNVIVLALAVIILKAYFVRMKENKSAISRVKFINILIPPGVGNKQFGQFYIDAPSGDALLGETQFHLESKSLVFDTSSQIREYYPRDDGSKEVTLTLSKPIKAIKSLYILINSGNSKSFYVSEKIGEIKLLFKDVPPITTDLILGKNIREWCIGAQGNLVREFSDPMSKVVWQGLNKNGTYAVIDCLNIPIHEAIKNNALEQIVFVHKPLQRQGDTLGVHYFVSAIAAEIERTTN